MKTTALVGKTTFSIEFHPANGPALVVHPRSATPPKQRVAALPIDRQAMAGIVRRWRSLGSPVLARGINPSTTAALSLARLGQLGISTTNRTNRTNPTNPTIP